jgi:hypothetical protein
MRSRICLLALAVALAGAFTAQADPTEEEVLKLDPDYAGGKKAVEMKDWSTAIRLLSSAALRDTRNADIQNYLGFAYRNSGQYDLCAPQKLDLAGLIALSSLTELCATGFSDSRFEIVPFCDSLFFPLLAPDNSLIRSLLIRCSNLRLNWCDGWRLALGAGFRGVGRNPNHQNTRTSLYFSLLAGEFTAEQGSRVTASTAKTRPRKSQFVPGPPISLYENLKSQFVISSWGGLRRAARKGERFRLDFGRGLRLDR